VTIFTCPDALAKKQMPIRDWYFIPAEAIIVNWVNLDLELLHLFMSFECFFNREEAIATSIGFA